MSVAPDRAPEPLRRIDSFPYRHRLGDVMTSPAVFVPPAATLADAAACMERMRISSVLVSGADEGQAAGIVTERDVLTAVARGGGAALARPVVDFMTAPVEWLAPDTMVYQAIGRMDRLGIRHVVVATDGRAVGMVTARALLKQRAGTALALGDQVSVAPDAETLGRVRGALPDLARHLLAEQVSPRDVAAVIGDVMRNITARSAALAEAQADSPPPAPYCVLILGSAGRGESLLAPDQDNALIHAGTRSDDPWYAALAERMTGILDAVGIPYCKGGVMASGPTWRRDRESWRDQVLGWVASPEPENLLNVDIFYDFHPVRGDRGLAEWLRREALDAAAGSIPFLKQMSVKLEQFQAPIGIFGGFRTRQGAVDLKLGGLFPVVAGARILALRHRIAATGTPERLAAAHGAGHLGAGDLKLLTEVHQAVLGAMLRQQINDIAAGGIAGNKVDVRRMEGETRKVLKSMVRRLNVVPRMVRDALVD